MQGIKRLTQLGTPCIQWGAAFSDFMRRAQGTFRRKIWDLCLGREAEHWEGKARVPCAAQHVWGRGEARPTKPHQAFLNYKQNSSPACWPRDRPWLNCHPKIKTRDGPEHGLRLSKSLAGTHWLPFSEQDARWARLACCISCILLPASLLPGADAPGALQFSIGAVCSPEQTGLFRWSPSILTWESSHASLLFSVLTWCIDHFNG